jgi:hypothetical protein
VSVRPNRSVIAGAVLLVAAAVAAVLLIGGGDGDSGDSESLRTLEAGGPTDSAPAATPFRLSYPKSWEQVPDEQLASLPGETVAVLRREGRSGLITVSRQPTPKNLDLEQVGARLGKQIKSGLADARQVAARPTRLPAGDAFVYSFVRRRAGTVHTVVVVPSGAVTYALNSVVPSGDNEAAQESGEIVRSLEFE